MIRPIPQIGDPILRTAATAVTLEELRGEETQQLIDDMIETMRHAEGAGIAAQQVGVPVRICILSVERNERYPYKPPLPLTVLVNPVLEVLEDVTFLNNEGCLSVPLRGDLHRFMTVRVRSLDRHGEKFEQTYRGLSAGSVQHELDHLDGHLIVDRIHDPTTFSTWDNFKMYGYDDYIRRIQPVIEKTEPRSEK